MLKIYCNHEKQDITYSFTMGQAFPDVKGKLLRIEISGAEMEKLIEVKEIPIYTSHGKTMYLVWNGKQCGSILKSLREVFAK